jgi:hypothetical protein
VMVVRKYPRPVHHNHHLTQMLVPDWYSAPLHIAAH